MNVSGSCMRASLTKLEKTRDKLAVMPANTDTSCALFSPARFATCPLDTTGAGKIDHESSFFMSYSRMVPNTD